MTGNNNASSRYVFFRMVISAGRRPRGIARKRAHAIYAQDAKRGREVTDVTGRDLPRAKLCAAAGIGLH